MRRFIWATVYVAAGVAAGCASAFALIQSAGVEPVAAGAPWQSRAAALAGPNAFYVRSHYLLEGRLPPAPSQLGESTAETDSDGRPLSGSCSYLISSTGPLPRWWSIGIIESADAKAALQTTADSDTAVREADGSVTVTAATVPQPGNWLKAPDKRRFTLIYSALSSGPRPLDPPFAIKRGALLMKKHLFWLLVAVVAGIVAHSAFALFVPGWWFAREVKQLARDHGKNSFFILSPEEQAKLFPGLPRFGVTGVCVFDVAKGDVTFAADLPDGFWITTIYTDKAEAIYSVNNRQSGANNFSVSLSRAPGLIEQILKSTEKEAIDEIDSGWTVTSPEPRGLAVVWYPTPRSDCAASPPNRSAARAATAGPAGES